MGRIYDATYGMYSHFVECLSNPAIERLNIEPTSEFINRTHRLLIEAIGNKEVYKQTYDIEPIDYQASFEVLNIIVEMQLKNFKSQLCREVEYDTFMINIYLDGNAVCNSGMWSNDSI